MVLFSEFSINSEAPRTIEKRRVSLLVSVIFNCDLSSSTVYKVFISSVMYIYTSSSWLFNPEVVPVFTVILYSVSATPPVILKVTEVEVDVILATTTKLAVVPSSIFIDEVVILTAEIVSPTAKTGEKSKVRVFTSSGCFINDWIVFPSVYSILSFYQVLLHYLVYHFVYFHLLYQILYYYL